MLSREVSQVLYNTVKLIQNGCRRSILILACVAVLIASAARAESFFLPYSSVADELSYTCESGYEEVFQAVVDCSRHIPEVILQDFRNEGWQIIVGDDHINEYMEQNNRTNVIGLIAYSQKTIWIKDSRATWHEWGHYLYSRMEDTNEIVDIFLQDYDKIAGCLGEHYKESDSEYFAECFELYLRGKLLGVFRNRLQDNFSNMYGYLIRLEADGWGMTEQV